jgi:putative peptidoglycan lipid II flippase
MSGANPVSPPEKAAGAGSASSMVAAGILLSRVFGLVREAVFARYFGSTLYADVFKAGLRMPNVLQNLLGEGTLSASFIPVYAELLEEGREEEAGRVAGAIFAILLAVAGALSLVGVLFAPALVQILLPGFEGERRVLTIAAVRILFPMTGVLVLSAWSLGILNSHRRFFIPYVAPVLWNGAIIGTLFLLGGRLDLPRLVIALSWGALLGGVLQFAVQLPWVFRLERRLKISWGTQLSGVREAVRNAGPAVLGRGVVQLSGWIDMVLASLLAVGGVAFISYAQTIYVLPVSLFGMSVAAAELPELARRRTGALDVLRERASAGLQRVAFYVVPTFVVFLVLGDIVVAFLFERGEFNRQDTLIVYLTLLGYTTGLLASTATRLLSSTFFALRDTVTPARVAGLRVLVAALLGFGLMVQFEPVSLFGLQLGPGIFADRRIGGQPLGPVGLAVGAGVAAWLEWYLLRRALRRRMGGVGAGAAPLARMFGAAVAAAAAGWGVRLLLPPLNSILLGILILGAFGVTYLAIAAALKLEETRTVLSRVDGLLRRNR